MVTKINALDWVMKVDDTAPPLTVQLVNNNGPIDLTPATRVRLLIWDQDNNVKVDAECVIDDDPETGRLSYQWQEGDTDTAGLFDFEFVIAWQDLTVESIPKDEYYHLRITP